MSLWRTFSPYPGRILCESHNAARETTQEQNSETNEVSNSAKIQTNTSPAP